MLRFVCVDSHRNYWEKKGYSVEERFPLTGFVYFGKDDESPKRVFWSWKDGDENPLSLGASWGFPTEEERVTIVRLLVEYRSAIREFEESKG